MSIRHVIELKPASSGIYPERVVVNMPEDWRAIVLEAQNAEGEVVSLVLNQTQAFQLAGNIQGCAFLIR